MNEHQHIDRAAGVAPVRRTLSAFAGQVIAVIAILLAMILATAGPASAAVGDSRTIPSFYGVGSVSLTSPSFAGNVVWDYTGGPYCVYVQYKHVATFGLDATWNRLTGNSCGPRASGYWSQPTSRAFNGMKFRLCQDKPNATDPCGADVTIYR